jgi:hypothetical protein
VLIAELAGERRYLKVFRRGHGEAARVRHHLLRGEGVPVPRVIEVPAPDVLAMYPAEGRPLAELLMSDGAQALDPHSLVRLLASFPRAALELPERRPWSARIGAYGDGAAAVLPDHAERIRSLAASIDSLVKATPAGPLVPSHGDFYEANLLVSGGQSRVCWMLTPWGRGTSLTTWGASWDTCSCFPRWTPDTSMSPRRRSGSPPRSKSTSIPLRCGRGQRGLR